MRIRAWKGCTNSVNLALTAVMMNPNCPLHRLSDEERVWMITFMMLLWGNKQERYVEIGENRMISDTIRFPSRCTDVEHSFRI